MERGTLDVAGVRRSYWLARGPDAGAPLLVARSTCRPGSSGPSPAAWTLAVSCWTW